MKRVIRSALSKSEQISLKHAHEGIKYDEIERTQSFSNYESALAFANSHGGGYDSIRYGDPCTVRVVDVFELTPLYTYSFDINIAVGKDRKFDRHVDNYQTIVPESEVRSELDEYARKVTGLGNACYDRKSLTVSGPVMQRKLIRTECIE